MRAGFSVRASSAVAAGRPSRARAGGSQLLHRPVGLDQRPAAVREVEPIAERLTGIAAMAAAAERGSEVDQRPRVREAELGAGEDIRRLARQLDHGGARREQRPHPESLADRLGSAEPTRDLELLVHELAGSIALAGSRVAYAFNDGKIRIEPFTAKIGTLPATISGSAGVLDKTLNLTFALKVPTAALTGSAKALPCRGRWEFAADGPLGWLAGARQLASFRQAGFRMSFA